ncbi:RIP metalloprotease RseP [Allosphingosinicella indica]|uniref:Zinc metalloprotease n=1 Tax=Allosphingosinicella indica TaxID=941907 RepID=A0A1X7GYC5_9SPHN|nr:RIP metalloprotease RseP [Allosphingosinicella indica]SMF76502.1 site-2 protease. Metallo peptidase. MEROPS family M50B [Allosphingosinicella indica]
MTLEGPGFLLTVLSFLLVIGPLVFVHEMGHFLVGRYFGVHAETFSIGFGREIAGWTDKRGTRWKIGWLPLGGYVRFKGDMNPASQPTADWLALPAEERNKTFQAKPVWQRFLIVAAGPAINFVFAILIYIALFGSFGEPRTPPVIAGIQENSAAAAAGFEPGDRIVAIQGSRVERFEDIRTYVSLRPGQPLTFLVQREERRIELTGTPASHVMRDRFGNEAKIGLLGIAPGAPQFISLGPIETVVASFRHTADTLDTMVTAIWQIITGQRSVKEMAGPVKMAQISGQQASLGWLNLIEFMALISINLGFINLLPIPLLDGGHLLFYTIEAVRRKPLKPEAQEWAFRTGLAALLALMIFVTLNDLSSLGVWRQLGGLIG